MAWLIPSLLAVFLGSANAFNDKASKALESLGDNPPYRVEGPYLVSAIIPTYNEADYLPACLTSLKNQTYTPIEAIIVDYQSEDMTKSIASSMGAEVLDIEARGIGLARDKGVAHSRGEILFHTDADCVYEWKFVEECVRTLERGYDLVQVPYTHYDTKNPLFQVGCAVRSFKADWQTSGQCIIGWRRIFEKLTFLGMEAGEDYMLGLRAKKAGYKIAKRRDLCLATSARRWWGQSRAPYHPSSRFYLELL